MATTKEEKTVYFMFSYYTCIPKVKLNTDWQISILSKTVSIIDKIASILVLHWVKNFWLCKKYLRLLAKKVNLITKNIFLGDLEIRLGEV